jgi:hypothetical protein
MERFNLKKFNESEDKEQYGVELSDRFTALENLDDDVDIKSFSNDYREYQNLRQRQSRLLSTEEA